MELSTEKTKRWRLSSRTLNKHDIYPRVGDRVKILDPDIFSLKHRKNRNGVLRRIDGAYHYVRPTWWPRGRWLELYEGEFQVIGR